MRELIVSRKSGFRNKRPDLPVIIRDKKGVIFYRTDIISKPVKGFNLPKGHYFIESGSIEQMEKPRKYRLVKLPRPERVMEDPRKFQILFGNNPNKCTVNWRLKTITFDNSFRDKPKYITAFILCHEFGHQFYGTEHIADLYSRNCMLKMGYNPSQIGLAPISSLSGLQDKRKEIIVKSFIK